VFAAPQLPIQVAQHRSVLDVHIHRGTTAGAAEPDRDDLFLAASPRSGAARRCSPARLQSRMSAGAETLAMRIRPDRGLAARNKFVAIRSAAPAVVHVDVYVEYRAVLRDLELAAAARRTLVGVRRERRGKVQLS